MVKSEKPGKSRKTETYRETTIEQTFPSGMYVARPLVNNQFRLVRADTLRGIKNMIDLVLEENDCGGS